MASSKFSNLYKRRDIGLLDESSPADMSWLLDGDLATILSENSAIEYFRLMLDIFLNGNPNPEKLLPLLMSNIQYNKDGSITGVPHNKSLKEIVSYTTLSNQYFSKICFHGIDLFTLLSIKELLKEYDFLRDKSTIAFIDFSKNISKIDLLLKSKDIDVINGYCFTLPDPN
jgi:hypothetical protein